jgi:hypothetical protein
VGTVRFAHPCYSKIDYRVPVPKGMLSRERPSAAERLAIGIEPTLSSLLLPYSVIVVSGFIGNFWSRMVKPEFFLMTAAIAAVGSAIIFVCRWPLRGALKD